MSSPNKTTSVVMACGFVAVFAVVGFVAAQPSFLHAPAAVHPAVETSLMPKPRVSRPSHTSSGHIRAQAQAQNVEPDVSAEVASTVSPLALGVGALASLVAAFVWKIRSVAKVANNSEFSDECRLSLAAVPTRIWVDEGSTSSNVTTTMAMFSSSGESVLARNYATALIELGQEGENLEQLHSDATNFLSILEDEDFKEFFNNPLLVGEKQKEIITSLCDEANMTQTFKDALCFLVDNRRIFQLPAILKEFDTLFYEATGTQVATVTSAVPMGEEELRLIANALHSIEGGKNVKIKSVVDESLIAGFVLEYGKNASQRADMSIKGQLAEMESQVQEAISIILSEEVSTTVQVMAMSVGINALLACSAHAESGNIFDFGLTMPIQMVQFLLLMVFLDKTVFTPVGKMIDERAEYIRSQNAKGADNSKEVAALNAQAEALLEAARRDAAKAVEAAKKEAYAKAGEMVAKAKVEIEASLTSSMEEVQKARDELWAKLEEEVVPVLVDDIMEKLMEDAEDSPEPAAATATTE